MPALVCFVVGTRAQLVKMAPVLRCAERSGLLFRVWFSGQHGESMGDLLHDFGLQVDERYCGAFGERDSVFSLAAWLPVALRECVRFLRRAENDLKRKPLVVVHGDTLSTLLGAAAARLIRAPVAHVESGLSSGSPFTPFPEEVVRRMVFRLSNIAYCPNPESERVMARFRHKQVVGTQGNTIIDSLRMALRQAPTPGVGGAYRPYAVFSIHRFENIYRAKRLERIVGWILEAATRHEIWFVLHPATLKRLENDGWLHALRSNQAITLSPRMSYSRFVSLLGSASVVVSDGGSNQEELACMGVPTILMRARSERPDGLHKNVILESDLGCPLGQYLTEGRYGELRCGNSLDERGSPSERIVADLVRRAGLG